jgi:hypothetical protein
MRARLGFLRRSVDVDVKAGAFAVFNPDFEIQATQVGCHNTHRILLDLDVTELSCRGLFDDDLVTVPLRSARVRSLLAAERCEVLRCPLERRRPERFQTVILGPRWL